MSSSSKTCDCEYIMNENVLLNTKIIDLQNILSKFTLGHKNFNMLLGSQKCAFRREGLGYRPYIKRKFLKNYFVKASDSHAKNEINEDITCHACNKKGHKIFECMNKNVIKNAWIPQGIKTNPDGPKKVWVPKCN